MKNLLGRAVTRMFMHTGVHLGFGANATVSTSVDKERHKVTMEVAPVGILAKWPDGREKLFPYSNVIEVDLQADDEVPAKVKA